MLDVNVYYSYITLLNTNNLKRAYKKALLPQTTAVVVTALH